jgi:hypothetical protein
VLVLFWGFIKVIPCFYVWVFACCLGWQTFSNVLYSFPWRVICTKVLIGPWSLPNHPLLKGVMLDPNALMVTVQQNLTRPHAVVPCGLFLQQVKGLNMYDNLLTFTSPNVL